MTGPAFIQPTPGDTVTSDRPPPSRRARACAAAFLAVGLCCGAQAAAAMTPEAALAFFDSYCGSPTAANADPAYGLPDGWQQELAPGGLQVLAQWSVAEALAEGVLPAEEAREELRFQRDILAGMSARDGVRVLTDGAGGWMFLADGLHPEFKNRTCLLVLPDDGSATGALAAALPYVPQAATGGTARWIFDGGFGSGEAREMYRRSAFVFTGTDGAAYWGLDWRTEVPR